jgi:hypothetical protein
MKKRIALVLTAAAVLAAPVALFAWGDAGHRITGEAAALALPADAPACLRNASRELAYLTPEPDRWKDRAESTLDPALTGESSPDHFIDMEAVPPTVLAEALKAPNRYAYLARLGEADIDAVKVGFLPFAILEKAQELREDFRLWRAANDTTRPWIEARIIDDAGILGHYVADGSNPAHTTVQFNGWTGPNPNGYATDKQFHARFESDYVGAKITLADVAPQVDPTPRVFPDLRTAIIDYLTVSNSQVERLYQIDKAHRYDATTTAPENKAFAVERLAAGARMLRDVWWTAWVTSGEPAPTRRP